MPIQSNVYCGYATAMEWLQSGMECIGLRRRSEYSRSADNDLEARHTHVQQASIRLDQWAFVAFSVVFIYCGNEAGYSYWLRVVFFRSKSNYFHVIIVTISSSSSNN